MEEYIGKNLRIKTDNGNVEGKMLAIDLENGKVTIETLDNLLDINFNDVFNVSVVEADLLPSPLKETDMYMLFYEAFNVFGPFEEEFIYMTANTLKKFFRDISTADVKIIIGSDDVFGRIGLCFARLALNRGASVSIELRCDLHDVRTLKYKNVFENSGGRFGQSINDTLFGMILFACNRNAKFDIGNLKSTQIVLLDIPKSVELPNFIGFGLGFVPEHCAKCNKFYYVIDVGFGTTLVKKYRLPQNFKTNLVKFEIPKGSLNNLI